MTQEPLRHCESGGEEFRLDMVEPFKFVNQLYLAYIHASQLQNMFTLEGKDEKYRVHIV